ncbi:MFS transporter [Marinobacter oulmenensis]|uniref:MFS family permease n=1 Tax=Marinobacter oulmenensis TaxID=643747 RepID=A0A840ULY3_9GAMM|nr:MFS transporter [Marinobacter oulmenensis]MBB5321698.1 MFS family permease [Marinobacter oulmenensis]
MQNPHPEVSRNDVITNMVAICFGLTSAFMVQTMLLIAVPLYALELGATPLLVGGILCVPYLLPLVLAIPLGGVITRLGGKKVIIVGAVGMMAGPWAILCLPGYGGVVLAQLIVGIAHIVMVLAAQSIISGLGHGKALERYFGWYTTCLSGGQLIGPLLAGWLIDAHSSILAFGVMGSIASIGVISGFFLTGSAKVGQPTEKSLIGYRAQARLLKTNSGVRVSIALTVAVMFALGAHGTFLPVYLESLSVSATVIGGLVSLRALFAMGVRPFMSPIIAFLGGRAPAMVWSAAIVAIGLMFTGLTGNAYVLGVLAVLVGIGSGISQPLSMVVLAEHVSAAQRSSALGMRLMGNRGVQFLAPLMLGFLAEIMPFNMTFFIAGLVVLFFAGIIIYLIPDFKKQEQDFNLKDG